MADPNVEELERAALRTQERLAFLLDVSIALSSSLEYRRVIPDVVAMTVPRFADACSVDLWNADGGSETLAVAHVDPELESALRALKARKISRAALEELTQGVPRILPRPDEEKLRRLARGDEEAVPLLRKVVAPSSILAPIVSRGRKLGAVIFGSHLRAFEEHDLQIAELVARRIAIAIDSANLLADEQRARHLAEELRDAMAASEERYRNIVETAQEGVWIIDASMRTTFVNARMAEMLRTTPGEMIGQSALNWIQPASRETLLARFRARAAGEAASSEAVDVPLRRRDGSVVWTMITGATVRGPSGEVEMIGMVTDVSARRATVEKQRFLAEATPLLASSLDVEKTLARIAELMVPILADWTSVELLDTDGTVRQIAVAHVEPAKVALAAELNRRWPADRSPGTPFAELVRTGEPIFMPEIPQELLLKAARDEEHREVILGLQLRSALSVPIKVRERVVGVISLIFAESGRRYSREDLDFAVDLARRAASALENARLYAAEQEARREAERSAGRLSRLQTVTASLMAGGSREGIAGSALQAVLPAVGGDGGVVSMLSTDGTEVEIVASSGYEGVPGIERRRRPISDPAVIVEVIRSGRAAWLETPEDWDAWPGMERFRQAVGVCLPLTVEGRRIGSLWVGFPRGTKLSPEHRDLLNAVTQQCAQALERAQLLREAQEANRLKDEFLATLSHELRTPLHAIMGWLEMIKARPDDKERRGKALAVIERNARAQAALVEDLLDVSRIVNGKFTISLAPTDPIRPIEAAIESIRPAVEAKKLKLEIRMPKSLEPINADAPRLQQVVMNLLSNAVKFTPPSGVISVTVTSSPGDVVLHVSDTGAGITPEFLPHVFDRFRQADSSSTRLHGGMGLGLSIARYLVEEHGGRISAESRGRGLGATFSVRLPRRAGAASSLASRGSESSPLMLPDLHGIDVLLVDDDPDLLAVTAETLEHQRAKVRVASSAKAAYDEFRRRRPDVLLADLGMKDGEEDGYWLIRRVRDLSAGRDVPAVALTGYASADDRARVLLAGFQSHLVKPVDVPELIAVVASLARGRENGRKPKPAVKRVRAAKLVRRKKRS